MVTTLLYKTGSGMDPLLLVRWAVTGLTGHGYNCLEGEADVEGVGSS